MIAAAAVLLRFAQDDQIKKTLKSSAARPVRTTAPAATHGQCPIAEHRRRSMLANGGLWKPTLEHPAPGR